MATVFPRNVLLSILNAKNPAAKLFSLIENTNTLPQILKAYQDGRTSANVRRVISLITDAMQVPRTVPYNLVTRNVRQAIINAPSVQATQMIANIARDVASARTLVTQLSGKVRKTANDKAFIVKMNDFIKVNESASKIQSAFRSRVVKEVRQVVPTTDALLSRQVLTIHPLKSDEKNYNTFFNNTKGVITDFIQEQFKTGVKVDLLFQGIFKKETADGEVIHTSIKVNFSKNKGMAVVTNKNDINKTVESMINEICYNIEDKASLPSTGYEFEKCEILKVIVVPYTPLSGSSYIQLPQCLRNSMFGLVNIQNKDLKCFTWCILARQFPATKDKERVSKYLQHENTLNMTGITYPVKADDKVIKKIEKQNNLSINIYTNEGRQIHPHIISKSHHESHVDLLLIREGDNSHYVLITNLGRLVAGVASTKDKKVHICHNCLLMFSSLERLEDHRSLGCENRPLCRAEFPKEGENVLKFKNHLDKFRKPFVIYADAEAFTEKFKGATTDSKMVQQAYQKHTANSYGYYLHSDFPQIVPSGYKLFRSTNSTDDFLADIKQTARNIYETTKDINVPLKMTQRDHLSFKVESICHICGGDKFTPEDEAVRDHEHFTGEYIGKAHRSCNLLRRRDRDSVTVFFHNLKGYDSHLLMQKFGKYFELSAIATNLDTYISFFGEFKVPSTKWCKKTKQMKDCERTIKVDFKDSLAFLSCSLDTVAKTLKDTDCRILNAHFSGDQFKCMRKKGVYPYSYADSSAVFQETCLPSIEKFHNDLNDEKCEKYAYDFAQQVWSEFNCQTFADYHDLYLKSDILILADVFEKFRATTMTSFGLDPVHYHTTPGLAWNAGLKMTGVKLHLFTEEEADMFLFVENGIRGGYAGITKRLEVANNHMCPGYNRSKPNKWIMYDDANNLYGYAMSRALPTGGFKWVSPDLDLNHYTNTSARGAIFQVDLHYPKELHDKHNDFPCAPERRTVKADELSPLQNFMSPKYKDKTQKLLQTLSDKKGYIVHYSALQEYVKQGLIITKVHKVLEFDQSPWLEKYISFNSAKRADKNAGNFEKDYYKLMNNSFYGRTLMNVRGRSDIRFFTSETNNYMKKAQKCRNSPQYLGEHAFNDDLAAIHMRRTKCVLNTPIYLGMCILDISKQHMYNYWYNTIKATYGDKAKLLMTDTDSLCYSVETKDIYQDRLAIMDELDNSKYPTDMDGLTFPVKHILHNNNAIVGKFKDEKNGEVIHKFVGVRAKCYSYVMADKKTENKCKGVKTSYVKKNIQFENYERCILSMNEDKTSAKFNNLQKSHHEIYATTMTKNAISCSDTKRYLCDDNIHTRAYGHHLN